MKNFLIILIIMFNTKVISAQNCDTYLCVITKVKNALKSKDYQIAMNNLESADGYDDKNLLEIRNLRRTIFEAIEEEKNEAKRQRDRATKSLIRVDSLRKIADLEKRNTQEALTNLEKALKELEDANLNQVRLLLIDARRNQNELKFETAIEKLTIEKLTIARLLRAIPDSVDSAYQLLYQSIIQNIEKNIKAKNYQLALAELLIAKKIDVNINSRDVILWKIKKQLEDEISLEIANSNYQFAMEANRLLESLPEKDKDCVLYNYTEIAFCLIESGQLIKSIDALINIASIQNNTRISISLKDSSSTFHTESYLREILKELDSTNVSICKNRYFPKGLNIATNPAPSESQNKTYEFGINELTFYEYDLFCNATGHLKPQDNGWGRGNRPVIDVSWYDAIEYCNWRSRRESLEEVYTIDRKNNFRRDTSSFNLVVSQKQHSNGYRLPTKSEWEYIAKKERVFSFHPDSLVNSNFLANVADQSIVSKFPNWAVFPNNFNDGFVFTAPVNSFPLAGWSFNDMIGNVWEWCWNDTENEKLNQKVNFVNHQHNQVICGGSWSSSLKDCTSGAFFFINPMYKKFNIGFRLVKTSN